MSAEETEATRVAIYVRQSVREDQGIEQQISDCKRRASGEGWQVVDIYNDNKISASKARGAGTEWARMLADIDAGLVDAIVAVKAARLLRRTEDVLEITKRKIRVVTTGDGIDTASAFGKAILTIIVALAESEIEEKEERSKPYRAARRIQGHPTPGRVPYGYAWVPKMLRDQRETRYRIVPEEAAVLRFMSRELLKGATLGEIVRTLNDGAATDEDGAKLNESSRRTRAKRDASSNVVRPGARWTTTTARRLLISPFPAALLPPRIDDGPHYDASKIDITKCTAGNWEAILSEDKVLGARAILLARSRLNHDGNTRAKWILSGIGRCGKCGGPLRSCTTKTSARSVRAYRCTAGCFQRPAAMIEAFIDESMIALLSAPGLLQWRPDEGADVDALRARRAALQGKREEAGGLWDDGIISNEQARTIVARMDSELGEIDSALAQALRADPLAEVVMSDDLRALWEDLATARKRQILGALVHRIDVFPVGNGRRIESVEATEGTVSMGWRRAEHRVSLDQARSLVSLTPRVPLQARDVVVSALSA